MLLHRSFVMRASHHAKATRGDVGNPNQMSKTATIRQVMTPCPHTIGSDQPLAQAHKIMRELGIRHLPVLRGRQLVGVVSHRDLLFIETIAGVDVDIDSVADAMSSDVYTTYPEESLLAVARVMAARKFGCAVVMDKGRVAGIFTVTDALRVLTYLLG